MSGENSFRSELQHLINKFSLEKASNTPDFILAAFLENVLTDWNHAIRARDKWFEGDRPRRYLGMVSHSTVIEPHKMDVSCWCGETHHREDFL